ncbi:hypothetical protein Gohar_002825, partial [Gossypium harknessii]|nr:hypothetical protein [Gossypium harknessii]
MVEQWLTKWRVKICKEFEHMQAKIEQMLDCKLQHVDEIIAETKTQVFNQMHEEIDKMIGGKKVGNFMVDPLIEENQTMEASINLSSVSYVSNPPKSMLTKTMAVTTNFDPLCYSLTPSKLMS